MESRTDEKGCKMLSDLGAWIVERIVEAQQTHFEAFKVIINQYTSS